MNERLMKSYWTLVTWSLLPCSGVLLLTATLHRIGLDSPSYTRSPLIPVEMILLIIVAVLILVQPILVVICCFQRQWRKLGIIAINTVVGIAALLGAMYIDSPTLIYMT